jgi:uncharacterized membrane protein
MRFRSAFKILCLLVLTFLYISVGVKHFTNHNFFLAIMPPYIPYHNFMVYLSGALEIVFALMMLFKKTRFYGCWGIIVLLIAVFPANIYLYNSEIPQKILSVTKHEALIRLPYQLPLLLFAFWHSKEESSIRLDFLCFLFFPPTIYYFITL